MSHNHFKIQTEAFEGPLDLLLSLIEKRKLLINDISLSKVADDFISHIGDQSTFSLDQTSHFILIASTLLLIKSKSLLPTISLTHDEERDISDLEIRLKMHQRFKEAIVHIENSFGKRTQHEKRYFSSQESVFAPSKQITIQTIQETIRDLIHSLPKKVNLPKINVKKTISLEEMIQRLTRRIQEGLQTSFKEFSKIDKAEKVDVIISFLAMLELVKQGIINTRQDSRYDDIKMEIKEVTTPNYS